MKLLGGLSRNLDSHVPRARLAPAFEGAGTGRRAKDWQGSVADVNSLLTAAGPALRSRARQAERNNGWISSGVESAAANWIGTGIKPQSRHPEAAVRQALHKAWKYWTDEGDADGITDIYGQQSILIRAEITAGECFARFIRPKAADTLLVPLKLQLIEADHVPLDLNEKRGANTIRSGIEIDANRSRVNYWVYPTHPGDTSGLDTSLDPLPIPAEEMLHIFRPLRPGQLRGQPRLTPALVKALTMHRYDDAEVERKTTAAMFALFVRMTQGLDAIQPMESVGLTPGQSREFVEQGLVGLEPNLIQALPPGWDVTVAQPADVGGNYGDFMIAQGQQIAAGGFGLAYHQMTGDLRQVSFSGLRAGNNESALRGEVYVHAVIVYQFCRRIWKPWLEAALMAGAFDRLGVEGVSNSQMLSAYNAEPLPFLDVAWHPPGKPSVNPLQDAQAAKVRVQSGFASRSQEIEKMGEDPEDVDRQIAEDQARQKELGIRLGESAEEPVDAGEKDEQPPAAPARRTQTVRPAMVQ